MNWLPKKGAILNGEVLSALRGPDVDMGDEHFPQRIKAVVTTRLRSLVFDSYLGDLITTPLEQYDIDKLRGDYSRVTLQYKPHQHFVVHLVEAIEVTRDNPIWGGLEDDLVDALWSFVASSSKKLNDHN